MSTAEIQETYVDSDGYVVDVATGEVLGLAEMPGPFTVDSQDKAEWAMERRHRIEAQMVALEARRTAVLLQLDAMKRDQERKLKWWDWRFGRALACTVVHLRALLCSAVQNSSVQP